MKHKKTLSLLLAISMLSSLCISGCGNNSEESKTSEAKESSVSKETQSEVAVDETEELEEKTVQIWLVGPGKQKDSDMVWEAFNEKLQEYIPNTTVEFNCFSYSEYKEKYRQMLASGEPVDLAWVASWFTGSIAQDVRDGNLLPIDDLLDEYGQGIKETLGEAVLDMHREEDGKLYYTVSWQGLYTQQLAFFVPTEFAQLAGDTWLEDTQDVVTKYWNTEYTVENNQAVYDQFDIYLNACKEDGKLYSGVDVRTFMGWYYSRFIDFGTNEVGPVRLDNSFTVVDSIQSEAFRVHAKNMADYYQKGYIRSDIASLDVSNDVSFVKNGEYNDNTVIVKVGNNLTPSVVEQESAAAGVDISAITIEEKGMLGKGDATAMAVPYCADEPERAMMVLNAIYTEPELYQLLIYGIEGEHYTDNGDGTITTSYGAEGTADSDYGLWRWTIGTCKNSLVTQNDVAGYYDELSEAEKDAKLNPFVNFSFDKSSVEDICSALSAVDKEYSDMIKRGYMGDQWEETLDKWIAERKAAGVDTLIEEYQKQLDAYIEANNVTSW